MPDFSHKSISYEDKSPSQPNLLSGPSHESRRMDSLFSHYPTFPEWTYNTQLDPESRWVSADNVEGEYTYRFGWETYTINHSQDFPSGLGMPRLPPTPRWRFQSIPSAVASVRRGRGGGLTPTWWENYGEKCLYRCLWKPSSVEMSMILFCFWKSIYIYISLQLCALA